MNQIIVSAFFRVSKTLCNILKPNFVFSYILLPLAVLTLYFVSFVYLLSDVWLLPNGVNYDFVTRSWKYLLFLLVGSSLMYLVFFYPNKTRDNVLASKKTIMKLSIGDFLLLLLPITPVVQYIINNQGILSPLESLYTLSIFLFLSGLYIFAIPILFSFVSSARIWMFLGLAFVHTLTSMALLSHNFNWYEEGSLKIQWMFFIGVFLITWILFNLNDKRVLRLLIVIVFLSNSTSQLLSPHVEGLSEESLRVADNNLLSHINGRIPVATPNIYLLIYDAYAPNETMLAHGIDNSLQEEYLKKLDFVLYPHTYSVASYTAGTMSRVLNASTDFYGSLRKGISGDGIVQNALKGLGYETYGIFQSDYFFQTDASTYDFSFPKRNLSIDTLMSGILLGEFRYDLGFRKISREEFIETKRNVFEGVSGNPVFIYMHSYSPGHSQNSGSCLPDETERYAARLSRGNSEMQQDIKTIMENDSAAIIIVAGDHGPYLTKNCILTEHKYDISEISRLDIQDRYGTFLAIRWPTKDFVKYDDITVLQDLFPAVFAYLYQDVSILESKVESLTLDANVVSGATIENNIINGGINDGEPLYVIGQ